MKDFLRKMFYKLGPVRKLVNERDLLRKKIAQIAEMVETDKSIKLADLGIIFEKEIICPQTALEQKYLKNCRVLSKREIELLESLPKNGIIAEVGVYLGDFSECILRVNKPKKLYLLDLWPGELTGYYEKVCKRFDKEIKAGIVEIIRGDSREVLKSFPDQYFDWVYLDTLHNYEMPSAELEIVQHKVKERGIIAGHDYIKWDYVAMVKYGVIEAVNEFCVKNDWEFVYLTLEHHGFHSYALQKNVNL
jgi:hypothetical protein